MRITEKDIMQALRNSGNDEATFEETLEKVASTAAEVDEVLEEEFGVSLADLDDEEALEVLADAGLSEEEIGEVMEALEEAVDDDDVDDDGDEFDKEAAAEEMYTMGYAYGAGFNAAVGEGLEKQADEVSDLKVALRAARQKKGLGKYETRLRKRGKYKTDIVKALKKYYGKAKLHKGKLGIGAGLVGLAGGAGAYAGSRRRK